MVLASWQPRSGVSLILLKHVGLLHEQACSLLACSVSTHVGREGTSRRAPGLRGSEDVAKSRCMTQVQGGLLRVVGRGRAPPKMFPARLHPVFTSSPFTMAAICARMHDSNQHICHRGTEYASNPPYPP